MRVRQAIPTDAAHVIALFERLYSETTFLLYEPGEMNRPVETYAKRMAEGYEKRKWMMFVAEVGEELVGIAHATRGDAKRTSHSCLVGLGVLTAHWRQGIGRALVSAIEVWAKDHGIHRIELTVISTNTRAIQLYERLGFGREGLKRRAQKVDGHYVDEYFMAKFV